MSVFKSLGVSPIINASGPVTRLGGARMSPAALEAYRLAAAESVSLEQLHAAASRAIARITGAEAGLVTCGSAAALTMGAAAILTRFDLGKMERLPHCEGMECEFVVAREHRSGYDHAVRLAGAKLVEVGFHEVVSGAGVRRAETWEYIAAFTPQTVGVLYVLTPDSRPPLAEVVSAAHEHGLPVLVDAAGELPPRSNLRLAAETGADLVAFSGGKAIGGPQATGILCGRRRLIASAALQMLDMDDHWDLWNPAADFIDKECLAGMPRHGIGRSMKVAKEEIAALLAALEAFAQGPDRHDIARRREWLEQIAAALAPERVRTELLVRSDGESPPILEVTVLSSNQAAGPDGRRSALEVCRTLRDGDPPVYVGHGRLHDGVLVINTACLTEDDVPRLIERLCAELNR